MIGRFRRRKEEIVFSAIPVSTLHRQMLYDGMEYEHIPALTEIAGLSPISQEGDEMERRDSEDRLDRITYLIPTLMQQANFMGLVAVQTQLKGMEREGIPYTQEDVEELAEAILRLLHTTLVSSVSTAVGLGLLDVPEVVREYQ